MQRKELFDILRPSETITQRPRFCVNLFRNPSNPEYTKRGSPTGRLRLPSASSARWTLVLLVSRTLRTLSALLEVQAPPTRLATGNAGVRIPRALLATTYARRSTTVRPIGPSSAELRGSALATNDGPMHGGITTTAATAATETPGRRTCRCGRWRFLQTGLAKAIRCCNRSHIRGIHGKRLYSWRRTTPIKGQWGRPRGYGRSAGALPVPLVALIRQGRRGFRARDQHPPTS